MIGNKKGNLETESNRSRRKSYAGKLIQQRTWRMAEGDGESDLFIVLGARESRVQGEGADRMTQLAKETSTGYVGLDK